MNLLKNVLTVFMVLIVTACDAQINNIKTESVKISGNCGMCESTIEKAGNLKNIVSVDWNKDTKTAIVRYDSTKTKRNEILKRIALAGYDSDSFFAPDDTYAALPGCCQYDRAKHSITSASKSEEMNHNNHADMKMEGDKMAVQMSGTVEKKSMEVMPSHAVKPEIQINPIQAVYNSYFALKEALVSTDGNTASSEANNLVEAISQIKMDQLAMDVHMVWMKINKDLLLGAQQIGKTKDIGKQRDIFIALSDNMYQLMKVSKAETPVYFQHCPMANNGKGANWLSTENVVKNPYYGSLMMSCGKTIETIK